jgi:hypothetical protein
LTKYSRRLLFCALATLVVAPTIAEAQVPSGSYECWFFTSPRSGLNFRLAGGRYTDVENHSGTVSYSGNSMIFSGGALDGVRAQYKGGNPPSVSILGPRGDEVSTCQLAN